MQTKHLLLLSVLLTPALQAQSYRFARIWDGKKLLTETVITVENGKIKSIGPPIATVKTIDLTRYTAIPGMIDVHTHMTYILPSAMGSLTQAGRAAATVFMSQENARKTLETGVTTVRNLARISHAV